MSKGPIILLVEDSEDDVFFMERTFERSEVGGSLHVVRNGGEAIGYLSGQSGYADREAHPLPDMVFLDLKMPGLDGFDVLEWVKTQSHLKMPVAVLTSSPAEQDMRRVSELGGACYLLKPPNPSMLVRCLKKFGLAE